MSKNKMKERLNVFLNSEKVQKGKAVALKVWKSKWFKGLSVILAILIMCQYCLIKKAEADSLTSWIESNPEIVENITFEDIETAFEESFEAPKPVETNTIPLWIQIPEGLLISIFLLSGTYNVCTFFENLFKKVKRD